MRPMLIVGIILLAIAFIGWFYLNMYKFTENEETNTSEINDVTEETENQSALQMIKVYCVDNSCAPQQIPIGAGTLAQGCFRDLNDCARYSINISCKSDSDCVGATCCHPTSCMNKAYRGMCNLLCTQVCQGPLDCGAGHCGCVNNRCTVIPK